MLADSALRWQGSLGSCRLEAASSLPYLMVGAWLGKNLQVLAARSWAVG